jgi:hypothetical protein
MEGQGRRTQLVCEACEQAFALDGNGVVAAAELEAWIAAHVYCGGTLRVEFAA